MPTERPSPWTAVDLLDRAAVRDALDGGAARRSSITAPASPMSMMPGARRRARCASTSLGTHHLLEAARDWGLACRVLVTGSALIYRPRARRARPKTIADRPAEPVRRQQAGAGDDRGARRRRRRCWSGRSIMRARASRPAYATSAFAQQIADIEAGRARAGAARRQPRRAARHHRRPRHGARLPSDRGSGQPQPPVQRLQRTRPRMRRAARHPAVAGAGAGPRRDRPGAAAAERQSRHPRQPRAADAPTPAGRRRSRSSRRSPTCSTTGARAA